MTEDETLHMNELSCSSIFFRLDRFLVLFSFLVVVIFTGVACLMFLFLTLRLPSSLHINGNKENILEGDADDDDNDISRREGRAHSRESLRNHLVMQRVSLVIRDAFDLSCSLEMNIITRKMTDAAKVTVMLTLSSLMFLINLPEQELCS